MIIVTHTYVKGTIEVTNTAAQDALVKNTYKKVLFKNCVPFTSCITKINNTQVDNAQDIDIVMSMYNLIECISYISVNHRIYIRNFMLITIETN